MCVYTFGCSISLPFSIIWAQEYLSPTSETTIHSGFYSIYKSKRNINIDKRNINKCIKININSIRKVSE